MNEIKEYIIAQVGKMVPEFEKLEFRASISDTSRSSEFFITRAGERLQCYEMVDNGLLSDEKLDETFAAIADYWRKCADYKKGQINKLNFIYER